MINVSELLKDKDFRTQIHLFLVNTNISTSGITAGEPVITHSADQVVTGVLVPNVTPDDLVVVPEGMRGNEMIKVYVPIELVYMSDDTIPSSNHFVRYQGKQWKVAYSKNWLNNGYFMGIAVHSPRAPIGDLV